MIFFAIFTFPPYCGSVQLALKPDPVRSVVKIDKTINLHNRLEILVLQISMKLYLFCNHHVMDQTVKLKHMLTFVKIQMIHRAECIAKRNNKNSVKKWKGRLDDLKIWGNNLAQARLPKSMGLPTEIVFLYNFTSSKKCSKGEIMIIMAYRQSLSLRTTLIVIGWNQFVINYSVWS